MFLNRLLIGSMLLIFSEHALAHSALAHSEPGERAVLGKSPNSIVLWFNEPVEPSYSKISIETKKGELINGLKSVTLVSGQKNAIKVEVPNLPVGEFIVRYRVLSVDGHVVESSYMFVIK